MSDCIQDSDEFFYQNEIAGLVETIKRHEQEIVDLKKELQAARADLEAKDLFIKSQSSLHEELKQQVINAKRNVEVDEISGGHEQ